MKKITSILTVVLLLALLAVPISAYDEMNVNIQDVQTTEIELVYKNKSVPNKIFNELSEKYSVTQDDSNTYVRFVVANMNIAEDLKNNFNNILKVFHDNKASEDINLNNIEFESSFNGATFGGRTEIVVDGEVPDAPINVHIKGSVSVNQDDYESDKVITPDMFPLYLEYGTSTIDELSITIEPESNYKTIDVTYVIRKSNGPYKQMTEDEYKAMGYEVLGYNNGSITLMYSYSDLMEFNNMFNYNLVRLFNIVGNLQIDSGKSLTKSMTVTGGVSKSESIDNVTLSIVMPEKSKDSVSGAVGQTFKYDMTRPFTTDISFTAANMSTVIIILVVALGIGMVVVCFITLNKRGAHIRIK